MQTIKEKYYNYSDRLSDNQKKRYLPLERKTITEIYRTISEKLGTELGLTVSLQLQMYKELTQFERDILEKQKVVVAKRGSIIDELIDLLS